MKRTHPFVLYGRYGSIPRLTESCHLIFPESYFPHCRCEATGMEWVPVYHSHLKGQNFRCLMQLYRCHYSIDVNIYYQVQFKHMTPTIKLDYLSRSQTHWFAWNMLWSLNIYMLMEDVFCMKFIDIIKELQLYKLSSAVNAYVWD